MGKEDVTEEIGNKSKQKYRLVWLEQIHNIKDKI